ncbi:MAG: type I restriction enzyme HsdR N-terminal domain-containing protein [Saprospiraceae bacterium]
MLLELNLLQYQPRLRFAKSGELALVFDPIRKKEVALTPEELLRQLVLLYLLEEKKYPAHRIRSEVGIKVNGLQRRCDIVVYDAAIKPWLLVECKSPKVPLNDKTFEQVARYNLQLRAPYLTVTNGLATYCASLDFEAETFGYLEGFPDYP